MASSKIIYDQPINVKDISISKNYPAKIESSSGSTKVFDEPLQVRSIKESNFYNAKVVNSKRTVKVSQKLPFYVRFENIVMVGYGPSNPAPIGVAVIGGNNWIL